MPDQNWRERRGGEGLEYEACVLEGRERISGEGTRD